MKKSKKRACIALALATVFMFTACEKENAEPVAEDPRFVKGEGVFLLNEGNFGWGNASLSYYDKLADTVYHDIFRDKNDESLGDVLNSAVIEDGMIYLVVNNSGKIVVAEAETMKKIAVIEGLVSPRYFVPVSEDKAYVSDLFGNHIRIIDTENASVSGEIPIEGWTEQIALVNGRVYATAVQASYLYEIDPQTDKVTDSLFLPPGPAALAADNDNNLWVLAGGEAMFKSSASLYRIDTQNFEIKAQIVLPDSPMMYFDISFCPAGETLYIIGDNVYRMGTTDPEPNVELLIESPVSFMSSMGVDPYNGDIYITDPVDYEQPGRVLIYNSQGQLKSTRDAGIIPGGFSFY